MVTRRAGGDGREAVAGGGGPSGPPFRVAGAWLSENTLAFSPTSRLPILREASFGAVYVKIHDGLNIHGEGIQYLARHRDEWREAGIYVVGWGFLQPDDPRVQANLAVSICRDHSLDGYILDAEMPTEGPAHYWRHPTWVGEFRRLAPVAPLGLSVIGYGFPHRDMPFGVYRDAGAVLIPQAYPNEYGSVYDLAACLSMVNRIGWQRKKVMMAIGTYGVDGKPYNPTPPSPNPQSHYDVTRDYIEPLKAMGTVGFSIFRGDTLVDDTYRRLGEAIREHGIAKAA